MSFQLVGLAPEQFAALFEQSDQALAAQNVRRVIADARPGFPCRVSLSDAQIGEELLLLSFAHLNADSPYRASGPIFVRKAARQARLASGEVPDYVLLRRMSVRGYDGGSMMLDAAVCDGKDAALTLRRMFENAAVSYIHLHNANRGCFSCRVERVGESLRS